MTLAARRASEFLEGLDRSEEAERRALERLVASNVDSAFGRDHDFRSIRSIDDFRSRVPIRDFEGLRPYVDRVLHGEAKVLTTEPVRRFFVTSGSMSKPKLVPVTSSFIKDKSRAFGIFWSLFFRDHPNVTGASLVTNFSDSGGRSETTDSGHPMGSETAFWAEATRATSRSEPLIPRQVAAIRDSTERYAAIAEALAAHDVRGLMALNPSTILRLFEVMKVPAFRAWPHLEVVVCWRSPTLQPYLSLMAPHLQGVAGRDYVMMASEGVMAIPLEDGPSGGALAVGVHFYELVPIEEHGRSRPTTLLPHEVEVGREYVIVFSTSGGLYRYDIGDVVRVRGFRGTTPIIEFLHRAGRTSSFTGEKLTEVQVTMAAMETADRLGVTLESFTLVPVATGVPHYRLVVETKGPVPRADLERFLDIFEERLGAHNSEYLDKRRSMRLGPIGLWAVRSGSYASARSQRVQLGANEEQEKPMHLSREPSFGSLFEIMERIGEGD